MDILGTSAVSGAVGVLTWATTVWTHRDRKKQEIHEQSDRLKVHQDDLTFQLLKVTREEIAAARLEAREARDELRALRPLEQDFHHVQQALEHLSELLYGAPENRRQAERSARAFLKRMRRLYEARGTITNEVQMAESKIHIAEGGFFKVDKSAPSD